MHSTIQLGVFMKNELKIGDLVCVYHPEAIWSGDRGMVVDIHDDKQPDPIAVVDLWLFQKIVEIPKRFIRIIEPRRLL